MNLPHAFKDRRSLENQYEEDVSHLVQARKRVLYGLSALAGHRVR
jgi:hypothetical protein